MKIIFDICYTDIEGSNKTNCSIAALLFDQFESKEIIKSYHVDLITNVAEYVSGEFYKKEMPCLQYMWNNLPQNIKNQIDTVIVDSLYDLWDGRPGMGHHFHDWLISEGYNVEVMGIAKKKFKDNSLYITKVIRGNDSTTPLNVNGSDKTKDYKKIVQSMAGDYRIPYMVKEVDKLSRTKTI